MIASVAWDQVRSLRQSMRASQFSPKYSGKERPCASRLSSCSLPSMDLLMVTSAPDRADVTISKSIEGKEQLLKRLAQGLSFPEYFGENWDALIDCLSDLTWSQATEAIIDHSGIPQLPPNDLR